MAKRSAAQAKGASEMARLDKNRDGVVSEPEFVSGGGSAEEFRQYDTNHDGTLDGREMEARAADMVDKQEEENASTKWRGWIPTRMVEWTGKSLCQQVGLMLSLIGTIQMSQMCIRDRYGGVLSVSCRCSVTACMMSERARIMSGLMLPDMLNPHPHPTLQSSPARANALADQQFDLLDVNRDGVIDRQEFAVARLRAPAHVLAEFAAAPRQRSQRRDGASPKERFVPKGENSAGHGASALLEAHVHQAKQHRSPSRGPKGRTSPPKAVNRAPRLSLKQIFSKFACANPISSASTATFAQISKANNLMDYTEFWRFAKQYQLAPNLIERSTLKSLFLAANVGEHADDHRGKLTLAEFIVCVRNCVEHAIVMVGELQLPSLVLELRALVLPATRDPATHPATAIPTLRQGSVAQPHRHQFQPQGLGLQQQQQCFDDMDLNGDGVVDKTEFRTGFHPEAGPRPEWTKDRRSAAASVAKSAARFMQQNGNAIDNLFDAMDRNKDGVVDRQEFLSHYAQGGNLSATLSRPPTVPKRYTASVSSSCDPWHQGGAASQEPGLTSPSPSPSPNQELTGVQAGDDREQLLQAMEAEKRAKFRMAQQAERERAARDKAELERQQAEQARVELELQVQQLQQQMNAAKAQAELLRMDTNKDGGVDRQEFVSAGGTDVEFDRYDTNEDGKLDGREMAKRSAAQAKGCLLYTSDAADEEDSVDLGGRRIIKKKKKKNTAMGNRKCKMSAQKRTLV
eukprot:TRINITY_DN18332_c0_g1_i11.p1 TRINITY_DN18332_c0_g1~~TRINITY_DN18332_c0_g1_i11.p1  ORF type:complete len:743 (-),score=183.36 TRINITY_DN18332_c0_g1_i11:25-2253(-)